MADLVVQIWPVDRPKPYGKNPRVIPEAAIDAVALSIKEYGFRQPIVVDEDDVIIVGHTRLLAARKLGMTTVPVHVAVGLTKAQAKAYRLADNRSSEFASWDKDLIHDELEELRKLDFDLSKTLFGVDEISAMSDNGGGQTDPDAVPEPPDEAVTKPGDLIILGNHRLLCGDSGSVADLDRLLGGAVIDCVNTDPPYNVKVEPRSNNAIAAGLSSFEKDGGRQVDYRGEDGHRAAKGKEGLTHHQGFDVARQGKKKATCKMRAKDRPLANDFVSDEAFDTMLAAWFGNISRVLKPGGAFYIWGGYANLGNYPGPLKAAELYFSQGIVWDKQHPVLTRKDYMGAFEICFYGWREGAGHHYYGPNNATDLWHIKKVNPQSMVHLTEKPVELAANAITNSSRAGENVLDLFGGSGSTLIACEQTGRRAFLMELDPPYCDVIVQRWEEFTGRKATRVSLPIAKKE